MPGRKPAPGQIAHYFLHPLCIYANLLKFRGKIQGGRIILKLEVLSRKKPVIQSIYWEDVGLARSGFKPRHVNMSR